MENVLLFTESVVPARNHQQQLKVIMNLPVRLISDNKVMDVLPMGQQSTELPYLRKRLKNPDDVSISFPNLNHLITFFQGCEMDDLMYSYEVADFYQVAPRTIRQWAKSKLLRRYQLTNNLVVYKRSELPPVEEFFSLFEL